MHCPNDCRVLRLFFSKPPPPPVPMTQVCVCVRSISLQVACAAYKTRVPFDHPAPGRSGALRDPNPTHPAPRPQEANVSERQYGGKCVRKDRATETLSTGVKCAVNANRTTRLAPATDSKANSSRRRSYRAVCPSVAFTASSHSGKKVSHDHVFSFALLTLGGCTETRTRPAGRNCPYVFRRTVVRCQ